MYHLLTREGTIQNYFVFDILMSKYILSLLIDVSTLFNTAFVFECQKAKERVGFFLKLRVSALTSSNIRLGLGTPCCFLRRLLTVARF